LIASNFEKVIGQEKNISVILAIRNEEEYICKCLDSLVEQDFSGNYEIIIVDGMSTDRTREKIDEYRNRFPTIIRIFDNPKRFQSSGRNIGIRNAKYKVVLIFDGHGIAENCYLDKIMESISGSPSYVAGVGGRHTFPRDETLMGKVIADVQNSILGGAGTSYRVIQNKNRYVNTLSGFCAYKKDIIERVGLYDERFRIAEDAEINWRIKKAGYRLLSIHDAIIYYYRKYSTFKLFSKRMFRYGVWKMVLAKKYPSSMGIVFYLPILLVLSVISLPLFFLLYPHLAELISISFLLFLIAIGLSSIHISVKRKSVKFLVCAPIYIIQHFSIGLGLLAGLIKKF
jgi:glycosyltransferase involved in cell wall biosynthesis